MPREVSTSLFPEPTPVKPAKSTAPKWITAHCDGGARGNPGPAGYGALVQDADGQILAELSEFLGHRTNNYAEYSGLLGCLNYALLHHHPRLRVVSDSELMVKQIQGKYQVKSPDLKPLYDEAKRRIAQLEAFEISHALRHKNKDADRLANEAMDRGMNDRGMNDRGMNDRSSSHTATAAPAKATPYPIKSQIPPNPYPSPAAPVSPASDTMLRGFTKDGVIHILGNKSLPDGLFVKIIRE